MISEILEKSLITKDGKDYYLLSRADVTEIIEISKFKGKIHYE